MAMYLFLHAHARAKENSEIDSNVYVDASIISYYYIQHRCIALCFSALSGHVGVSSIFVIVDIVCASVPAFLILLLLLMH